MAMTLPDSSISRIMEQWVEASRLRLAGEQHSTTIGSADVLVDELNRLRLELTAVKGQRDEAQLALQRLEQALAAARLDLAALQRRYDEAVAPAVADGAAAMPPARFDEQWYLDHYADVRDAVQRGLFGCAQEHYDLHGREEHRQARFIQG